MADYSQIPPRPNINPASVPPTTPPYSQTVTRDTNTVTREGSGWMPAVAVAAVIAIVALVGWGMVDNDAATDPAATTTQPAPDAVAPVAPAVTPDPTVTPAPTPMETPAPEPMVQPEATPPEVPAPAPEVTPAPAPAPAPAPTN